MNNSSKFKKKKVKGTGETTSSHLKFMIANYEVIHLHVQYVQVCRIDISTTYFCSMDLVKKANEYDQEMLQS